MSLKLHVDENHERQHQQNVNCGVAQATESQKSLEELLETIPSSPMPLVSTECGPNVRATVIDFTFSERYHSVFDTEGVTNFLSPPDAAVLVAVSEETSSCSIPLLSEEGCRTLTDAEIVSLDNSLYNEKDTIAPDEAVHERTLDASDLDNFSWNVPLPTSSWKWTFFQ
ncbi:hypothetical protein OUZ56_011781 [Daphnia magna]|uniref:Uncharacterized protein n=1 Tax=Daphnia magna TaxID=35525 RepID=A0ABQ9Z1B9_9CRUS|nr:hypothetical protein OUZ56_011781 [Daphnia magna]